jgi:hypothetical protein
VYGLVHCSRLFIHGENSADFSNAENVEANVAVEVDVSNNFEFEDSTLGVARWVILIH